MLIAKLRVIRKKNASTEATRIFTTTQNVITINNMRQATQPESEINNLGHKSTLVHQRAHWCRSNSKLAVGAVAEDKRHEVLLQMVFFSTLWASLLSEANERAKPL